MSNGLISPLGNTGRAEPSSRGACLIGKRKVHPVPDGDICLIADSNVSIHAFYLHKETQLPNPPFFVIPHDFLTQQQDQGPWNSFPLIRPEQKLHRDIGFKAHSELFSILYDFLRIRGISAAASDKVTEFHNANMLHSKMLVWADKLPPEMVRGPDSLPMVIDLQ